MSGPQRPHGLQPTMLLHPWDFPGKNIGVGCHCLLRYLLYYTQNRKKIPSCSPDYQMKKLYPIGAWQLKSIKNWLFQTQRPGCKCWICHLEATWSWKFLEFTESHINYGDSDGLKMNIFTGTPPIKSAEYNRVLATKKEILPFATTWMTLEGIILNKSDKDKYHI